MALFAADDRHCGLLPQVPAPAAGPRHDDRPGLPVGLRLLSARNSQRRSARAATTRSDVTGRQSRRTFDLFRKIAKRRSGTRCCSSTASSCASAALGTLGYLAGVSHSCTSIWGRPPPTCWSGLISAVVDNIPIMFAVLTMNPEMSHGQWLLVTLTAGVGGSLLSIGSAAGVALMGQARGVYTFLRPPQLDLGDRPGLCRQHRRPSADERALFPLRACPEITVTSCISSLSHLDGLQSPNPQRSLATLAV